MARCTRGVEVKKNKERPRTRERVPFLLENNCGGERNSWGENWANPPGRNVGSHIACSWVSVTLQWNSTESVCLLMRYGATRFSGGQKS